MIAAYYANVRSIVEYCKQIWGGTAKCHHIRMERVQYKFLMWLARHHANDGASFAYADLLSSFHVPHLGVRRARCDIRFLKASFLHQSSHLPECFKLRVSARQNKSSSLGCSDRQSEHHIAWIVSAHCVFLALPITLSSHQSQISFRLSASAQEADSGVPIPPTWRAWYNRVDFYHKNTRITF